MADKRRVLYVENDKILTTSLKKALNRVQEIELTVVRHMEDAITSIHGTKLFDAYIIDIMLPRNQTKLNRLDPLEEERMSKLDELIKETHLGPQPLTEKTLRLRAEIDQIDQEIEELLELEGGLELVEIIAKRHSGQQTDPTPLSVPVLFLTARAAPELKNKGGKYVRAGYVKWIEKPERNVIVVNTLLEMLGVKKESGNAAGSRA